MTTSTKHRGVFKTGTATVFAGLVGAVAAVSLSPAGAAGGPSTGSVIICHRTNAPSNPYLMIEVAYDSSNGGLVGPDHTGHSGPVFDFTADPEAEDYPYAPPLNEDDWGDIVPGYEWDGGSYPGLNWDEAGQAIWDAGCAAPAAEVVAPGDPDPQDEESPQVPVLPDTHVSPAAPESQETPAPEASLVSVSTNPVSVLGATEARPSELPRTGQHTLRLTAFGLGLVLLGAGTVMLGRQEEIAGI